MRPLKVDKSGVQKSPSIVVLLKGKKPMPFPKKPNSEEKINTGTNPPNAKETTSPTEQITNQIFPAEPRANVASPTHTTSNQRIQDKST